MLIEVMVDIFTIAIFSTLLIYTIWKKSTATPLFPMIILFSGVFIVSSSDIISLLVTSSHAECIAGKLTAAGTLISLAALFHAFSLFPTRSKMEVFVPTLYIVSALLILNLFLTPYLIYCDPLKGGMRGILWHTYLLWGYSLLIVDTAVPGLRLFTLKIRFQKMQTLLIFAGMLLAVLFLSITQVLPHFGFGDYHSAVYILPIIGAFYAYSMVGYGMFTRPVRESGDNCKIKIGDGKIVAIADSNTAFKVFRELSSVEKGMLISIKPPQYLVKNYGFSATQILWLSYFSERYEKCITPGRLHFEGMETVIHFVRGGGRVVLVEGIEYLMANFGRGFVIEFIESLRRIKDLKRIILAVENLEIVEGVASEVHSCRSNVTHPGVIMCRKYVGDDAFLITDRTLGKKGDNKNTLLLDKDFPVDRLIFEGLRHVEDSTAKNVYIESMDYIISVAGERNAANFLKDVIDVTVERNGCVYLLYTPLIEKSSLLRSLIDVIR